MDNQENTTPTNAENLPDNVHHTGQEKCPICLDDFPVERLVAFDNCSHSLCSQCRETFIETQNRCPVCRTPVRDEMAVMAESMARLQHLLTVTLHELQTLVAVNCKSHLAEIESSSSSTSSSSAPPTTTAPATTHDDVLRARQTFQRILNKAVDCGLISLRSSSRAQVGIIGTSAAPMETPSSLSTLSGLSGSSSPLFSPLFNALASMHSVPGMLDTTGVGAPSSFVVEETLFQRNPDGGGAFDITSYGGGGSSQNSSGRPRSFLDNIRDALHRFN